MAAEQLVGDIGGRRSEQWNFIEALDIDFWYGIETEVEDLRAASGGGFKEAGRPCGGGWFAGPRTALVMPLGSDFDGY